MLVNAMVVGLALAILAARLQGNARFVRLGINRRFADNAAQSRQQVASHLVIDLPHSWRM